MDAMIPNRSDRDIEGGFVFLGEDYQPVVFVKVRARTNAAPAHVTLFLQQFLGFGYPLGMFADLSEILVFGLESPNPGPPLISLKTSTMLAFYEPEIDLKRIFPDYFETLIEAWLRDFAFHWKSNRPPGSKELESIGLSQRLEGGMSFKGPMIDGFPVP